MRPLPRLGMVNLALVSLYFVPVWGHDAFRALVSPYGGFENPAQTAAATYFRELFDLGLAGLIRTGEILAVIKLVIAAAFVAYLIEFCRALVRGREANRETVDVVLVLALLAIPLWLAPAFTLGDAAALRLQATQFLLLMSAAVVIMIDRAAESAIVPPANQAKSNIDQSLATATSLRISPASPQA